MPDEYDITKPELFVDDFRRSNAVDDGGTPADSQSEGPKLKRGEAKILKDRMRRATRYYETVYKEKVERCVQMWKGEHWLKDEWPEDYHNIVINLTRYIIRTKVAALAFSPAEIIVKPEDPQGEMNQEIAERATGYEYRKSAAHREAKRALFDKTLLNLGVVKTGWEFETDSEYLDEGRLPVAGETPDPEEVTRVIMSGEELPEPVAAAKVRKDQFYARRIDPTQFRISPEADRVLERAEYCGYIECVPLDELKKDDRYKNTNGLKGSTKNLIGYMEKNTEKSQLDNEAPSDVRRVELWHYYERKRRLHVIFCDEHDRPLLTEEWPWEWDEYPFQLLHGPGLESEFYGDPEVLDWEQMQQEINAAASQLATVRAQDPVAYVATKGLLDNSNRKKLESTQVNRVVEVQGDPRGIAVLQHTSISPDSYNAAASAQKWMQMLSGVDQYALGEAPSKRLTTTEVQAIQGAGGAIKEDEAQDFEDFCGRIAFDCLRWLQQFATRTRTLPIYDPNDPEKIKGWASYDAEKIKGAYDLSVYVGSTQIQNKEGKMKEFGFLLQSLQPFASLVNIPELLKQYLANFPDLKNVAAIVTPPPPPMAPGGQPGPGPLPPEPGPAGGPGGEGGSLPPGITPAPPGSPLAVPGGLPPGLLAQIGGMG